MLFFLIMVGLYENGSFILLTLVPPRVPHSRFTYYFVIAGILLSQPIFLNGSCYTEAARCSIVRGQSKSKGPGGSAEKADAFSGAKIVKIDGDKSLYRVCKT